MGKFVEAVMHYQTGRAEAAEYKLQVKQEQDSARGREIERRRALLKALANQNAVAGAQGVAMSGGKAAIARSDIRDAQRDLLTDKAGTGMRVASYRARASNAKKAGTARAAVSIMEAAEKMAMAGG